MSFHRVMRDRLRNPDQCPVGIFQDCDHVPLAVYLQFEPLSNFFDLGESLENSFMNVFLAEAQNRLCF